ncbi:hypothetical protein HDU76_000591 [Blyttiomyces sp. JEL0837]|nr:hypothetical protein HDU76_000591 [Blyttiomyces sp. JEL0837]
MSDTGYVYKTMTFEATVIGSKLASEYGQFQIAELLLEDDRVAATEEAFAEAVEYKHFDIAKLLFDFNIDTWSTGDFCTDQPMKQAIENGEIETVNFWSPFADPDMLFADNPEEESERLPRDIAILKDHTECAKLLVNSFPESDFENEAKLQGTKGSLDVAKFLLGRDDIGPTAQNDGVLLEALLNGHKDIAKTLLEREDVDPMVHGNQPIQYAARRGSVEIVRLLLERDGVDPTTDNDNALRLAAAGGSFEVVQLFVGDSWVVRLLLCAEGVDVNVGYGYLLLVAVEIGNVEIVRLLLCAKGGDVNVRNGHALLLAVAHGHVEIVRLLLVEGIDVNVMDGIALRRAVERGQAAIVSLLLLAKGISERRLKRAVEIVRLFLAAGVKVNACDGYALRKVVEIGHVEIVSLLLDVKGVDVNVGAGYPLILAVEGGNIEIVRLLLKDSFCLNIRVNARDVTKGG